MSKVKVFYKIRHKETGMYYQPHRHNSIQLSLEGKVYHTMPSIKVYHDIFVVLGYGEIGKNRYLGGEEISERFNKHSWEIVTFEVVELYKEDFE